MKNIKLKGSKNIRDLGGMKTKYGTLKRGFILRASNLNSISKADERILKNDYNLKLVIDLRNDAEKAEKPDKEIAGVENIKMPVFDENVPGISRESKQNLDAVPDMTELYRYVVNSDCFFNIAKVVKKIVLYDGGGSVLYHCTSGKDRTGMVTAMLLTILGVQRKDIIEDYLFTNTVSVKKAKTLSFLVRYVKRKKEASVKVYNVFIAKKEYLNELFRVMDKYTESELLSDVIGITENELETFVSRVTVPV